MDLLQLIQNIMYGFNIAGPLFENETFSIWEGEKKNQNQKRDNDTITDITVKLPQFSSNLKISFLHTGILLAAEPGY